MSTPDDSISELNLDAVKSKESTLSIEFTGNALADIQNLKEILEFDSNKKVVNFAVALLAKAKKENSTIKIIDKDNNVTYNLEF